MLVCIPCFEESNANAASVEHGDKSGELENPDIGRGGKFRGFHDASSPQRQLQYVFIFRIVAIGGFFNMASIFIFPCFPDFAGHISSDILAFGIKSPRLP